MGNTVFNQYLTKLYFQVQHLQQQLQLNQQLANLAPGTVAAAQPAPTPAPATTAAVIQDIPSPPAPNPPAKEVPPPLPQNWKTAKDSDGKIYYYHTVTR